MQVNASLTLDFADADDVPSLQYGSGRVASTTVRSEWDRLVPGDQPRRAICS
ncbi:MAG: hypothetical protein ACR2P0_10415 [Acidimicrobiales bacterium]